MNATYLLVAFAAISIPRVVSWYGTKLRRGARRLHTWLGQLQSRAAAALRYRLRRFLTEEDDVKRAPGVPRS
ncbi:hypothetical protein [Streptomyces sp. YIM 121038]|uniref:hypothetical protein n=1 Tax=Streptomyces sp. YIM 121038 TaxID=2136401 RepID=UPI001110861F|nr:hypothetical protein [Streptomyces sp. YIM 121038]